MYSSKQAKFLIEMQNFQQAAYFGVIYLCTLSKVLYLNFG